MSWILVTGGVASGIGKGVCAAVLARAWARHAGVVDYRKLEPCLQGELSNLPNSAFGDIITPRPGFAYDADVGRAAFLVPGYTPDQNADTSLRLLLETALSCAKGAAPRLLPLLAAAIPWPSTARRVVEVGGTAGEPEHGLMLDALHLRFGPPQAHLHVSTTVKLPGGRCSTKPAQVGLHTLRWPPDAIFFRGSPGPLASLTSAPLITVRSSPWPEAAWRNALRQLPGPLSEALGLNALDPHLSMSRSDPLPLHVCTDDAGAEGYTMLLTRLRGWSSGRLRISRYPSPHGVRIGERSVPSLHGAVFSLVPTESGQAPRDPAARPDWRGTLDQPEGSLWRWMCASGLTDRAR